MKQHNGLKPKFVSKREHNDRRPRQVTRN